MCLSNCFRGGKAEEDDVSSRKHEVVTENVLGSRASLAPNPAAPRCTKLESADDAAKIGSKEAKVLPSPLSSLRTMPSTRTSQASC